jgi:orotate phosphoribosyltransferase
MTRAEIVAKGLLSVEAVQLRQCEPFFKWARIPKAPIYCDNRLTLSDAAVRKDVELGLADLIRETYPNCEMLMGVATAGIPHAAIVATLLNVPMGVVRGKTKDHGAEKQIEGLFEKGQKIVVVEDLISTAGSCVDVVNCLREDGANVIGIVSIFNYEMDESTRRLQEAKVGNVSLVNLDLLLDIAASEGYIRKSAVPAIKFFRDNPGDESWMAMMRDV